MLRALAHQTLGDIPAALACLERAMTLAEPEGYVRVFIDEGPPMAALLRAAAKQGIARNYVRRLLAAVSETEHDSPIKQALIEPLSERELDVLRLLGTELDGPAIARELMVSLNTMRTHTKNIYAKLAVTNRRAAVRRAAELDLSANPQPATLTRRSRTPARGRPHARPSSDRPAPIPMNGVPPRPGSCVDPCRHRPRVSPSLTACLRRANHHINPHVW